MVVLISAVGTVGAQPDCSTVVYEEDADGDMLVENVDQLQCINDDPVGSYRLDNDIDAEETFEWNNGTGFEPIGVTFRGTFDGDGYTVTDLYIDRPDESEVGLFASTSGDAVVENVALEQTRVTGGEAVGGLVGRNEGEVRDAHVSGTVMGEGDASTGGVVGRNVGGVVTRSSSSADVVGYRYVGGLVGRNTGEVSLSYADGTVRGDDTVAGVVGYNLGTVRDSYSVVNAEGRVTVAGVVGRNRGSAVIRNTYAGAGRHRGTTEIRGLVAGNSATVEGSYYDVSSVDEAGDPMSDPGGIELTTDEMTGERARQTMTALDFEETWETVTNPDDYPVLAWQTEETPVLDGSDNGEDNEDGDGEDGDGNETDDESENGESGDDGAGDGVEDGTGDGDMDDGTDDTDNETDGMDDDTGTDEGENETDDETDGTEGDDSEGMPGFGVFVVLAAVVVVGLSRWFET